MVNKEPLYKRIENDILEKIQDGTYPANTLIPKEVDLTNVYQVSRPTVRQAIQNLVNEGYLERRKRLGTIVREKKINQEFTQIIESYDSEMIRKGLVPRTKVLSFKKMYATGEIADNLQVSKDTEVYKLVRLRYAEEKPVVIVTSYLLKKVLPEIDGEIFVDSSLYAILSSLGYPVIKIKRTLDVMLADETISDLLEINEGDPLFYFKSVGMSYNGLPVEYSISKYRGDINSFTFEISNTPK